MLSGLTSVGKTTFSNNLTLNLAHRNIPVMYISMEMPPIDICRKFLLLHKKLTGSEVDRITDETDALMPTIDA